MSYETLLARAIGESEIIEEERIRGPRGGKAWVVWKLSDGRVALRGPFTMGIAVPKWVQDLAPDGQHFIRAGGTTYQWTGWISTQNNEV